MGKDLWGNIARIGGLIAAPFTAGLSIPISQAVAGGVDMAVGNKHGAGQGALGKVATAGDNIASAAMPAFSAKSAIQAPNFAPDVTPPPSFQAQSMPERADGTTGPVDPGAFYRAYNREFGKGDPASFAPRPF